MGAAVSAWCPGGRTAQKARSLVLSSTRCTASSTAPAANRAARAEPALIVVSCSTRTMPLLGDACSTAAM